MLQPLNKTLFSVLALFFIGTAAFVSLDTFRGYRAEVTILVLPLSTNQTPAEQMVENIAILPTTVSFFDALIESDERLLAFSDIDEQPINIRSEKWNEMLAVKREGGSGIITYTIKADTQEEATLFARQMAKVLFLKIGTYYDIRSDLSLRLIEGPLVRASLNSPFVWIIQSVGIGVMLALLLVTAGSISRRFIGTPSRRKTTPPTTEALSPVSRSMDAAYPAIHPDTFIPKKPTVFFSEEGEARAREEKREYNPYVITPNSTPVSVETASLPVAPIETVSATSTTQPIAVEPLSTPTSIATTKSAAPANLPFIDEATFLAQFSSNTAQESTPQEPEINPIQSIITEQEVSTTPSLPAEPTMEDYRRRLNELLKEGK